MGFPDGTSKELSNTRECKLLADTHRTEEEKWEKKSMRKKEIYISGNRDMWKS